MKKQCEKADNLHLRSEEVQEVMGSIPPWILRWGIVLVVVVCIFFLIGSFVFRYTETVAGRVRFSYDQPIVSVCCPRQSVVKKVMAENGEVVRKGQQLLLATLGSEGEDSLYRSPIDGRIYFVTDLLSHAAYEPNAEVSISESIKTAERVTTETELRRLLVIVPLRSSCLSAAMYVSEDDRRRVAIGQRVVIKTSYQELQNGSDQTIEGRVKYVSAYPREDGLYLISISLPKSESGLHRTSYPMEGAAEVIVQDQRLIDALLRPLHDIKPL